MSTHINAASKGDIAETVTSAGRSFESAIHC